MKLTKKTKNVSLHLFLLYGTWGISNPALVFARFKSCVEQAATDLTVATTLIEARLITGNSQLAKWPRRIVSQHGQIKHFMTQNGRASQALSPTQQY